MSMSRRAVLSAAAITAGGVLLAGCTNSSKPSNQPAGQGSAPTTGGSSAKGDLTKSAPRPATIQEAPSLKGKGLPPVEQRLPKNPYVIPHRWMGPGKYGGRMNMVVFGTTGAANANSIAEFYYGNSLLRRLNDNLDIGPGVVDQWSANADVTEWTLHLRDGIKWSDGQPVTVDDILFWWEDLVLPGHDAQTPPTSNVSATGKLMTMAKQDDQTVKLTWDTPAPLFIDQFARWAGGMIGGNGPAWILPKHYLKQFHPKYNPKVPSDWDSPGGLWEQKANWTRNPDCPTLTGYKCKSFNNNTGILLERNPYYWVVNTNGDQLPYIDEVQFTMQTNAQNIKLQIQQGSVDFCMGQYNQISLADVSTLSTAKDKGNFDILLWNTGSGTGSIFFFNYDWIATDPKMGALIRDKRFIRAISYGWDRKATQKTLYFGTGELTTGTVGTATTEFHVGTKGPQIYKAWRDSYTKFDPAMAKQLLSELGLKDSDGDGYVEFPDGSKLTVQVPYSADIPAPESAKDDQLVSDMKKIGLHFVRNPISPATYTTDWSTGQLMSRTNWEASDTGSILGGAYWLLPVSNGWWAPLEATWFQNITTGKNKTELDVAPIKRHPPRMQPDKGGPIEKMTALYNQGIGERDAMKRDQLAWEIMQIHITEGPFFLGCTADFQNVITKNRDLANVPNGDNLALGGNTNPWENPTPAMYDPETWFWTNPDQHNT